jgi:hypothetical protein
MIKNFAQMRSVQASKPAKKTEPICRLQSRKVMRTARILRAALVAVPLLFMNTSAPAHEFATCRDTADQSCWSISNNSAEAVTLTCTHQGLGAEFRTEHLMPGRKWSYQYCPGLADGMGFSAGSVECDLRRKSAATKFRFESKEFGDRVAFVVTQREVATTVSSYWTKGSVKMQKTPLTHEE